MQVSDGGESDIEMEHEEDAEEQMEVEGHDGLEEDEDDEDEDEIESAMQDEDGDDPPTPPPQPRLKIKLKLPAHVSSLSNTTTPAPDDISLSKPTSRRALSRDVDIESEDDDNEQSRSTTSTSAAGPSSRPMTTRQAVLASVVDSTHVSLSEGSRKKKPLNESELALRREETARKRKNLSEKKLEDEKAETINRLLKKQSRAKNKRNAAASADDRTPASNSNPALVGTTADDESIDPDADNGIAAEPSPMPVPAVPVMYRWVSKASEGDNAERKMVLSFSVPTSVLPPSSKSSGPLVTDVDHQISAARDSSKLECDVQGCYGTRKYKLVKNWTLAACCMDHLKILEAGLK